ncbi:MAG: SprB repeat-containing protein [Flavobacteriales bacterium]
MASAQITVTLAPSDYNGYHVSCFGLKDGAIDATIAGGTAPYSHSWSNGAQTEDVTGLSSGLYILRVTDALGEVGTAEVTLIEPGQMKVRTEPFKYPNGHNVSCHDCFNGSIDLTVHGGVLPYTYNWGDEVYTQDRSGLGALSYAVVVTDANGCEERSEKLLLTQPERKDWTMEGNSNTDAEQHFFGTADAQDVVLKSNGLERFRLLSDGGIKLSSPLLSAGPIHIDENGLLRGGFRADLEPMPVGLCRLLDSWPYWETRGNDFTTLCPEEIPLLGSLSAHDVRLITSGETRIHITTTGKVGIGTEPPAGAVDEYRLYVEDGIATRDVLVKLGDWPDYVFQENYRLLPLNELRAFVKRHSHLPGIPSAADVEAKGGIEVGDLQRRMLETMEQQALYILQLEERVKQLEEASSTKR